MPEWFLASRYLRVAFLRFVSRQSPNVILARHNLTRTVIITPFSWTLTEPSMPFIKPPRIGFEYLRRGKLQPRRKSIKYKAQFKKHKYVILCTFLKICYKIESNQL